MNSQERTYTVNLKARYARPITVVAASPEEAYEKALDEDSVLGPDSLEFIDYCEPDYGYDINEVASEIDNESLSSIAGF